MARSRRTRGDRGRYTCGVPSSRSSLIVLLGCITAFGPLSIDMYLPGMPAIARDLASSEGAVKLTLASYFAGITIAQLVYGPIVDRWGRRRALLGGMAIYVAASLGCALAPSAPALIGLRFAQALGGAAGMVVPRAVVRDLWSGRDAARVLSLLMLVMGAAPVLAPSLGSLLVEVSGWRAVFAALAGLGAVALVAAARGLPETGTAVVASGHLAARYWALLRHRGFLGYAMTGGLGGAALFAYIAGSPFVLMELCGLSSRAFAIVFGVNAVGYIGGAQINRRLLARHTPRALLERILPVSLAAGALTVALAALGPPLVPLLATLFVFVASLGFIGPNATALALEDQAARAGLASAMLGTLMFAASAVVAAAVGVAGEGSALPMAIAMTASAAAALLALRLSPVPAAEVAAM
jgi:DHA1 family bicyclomycin/chloramphenicol resistance-like MFS transporter